MNYNTDEYYPTPESLITEMLKGINLDYITTILEPSAGKGNIVQSIRALNDRYRNREFDIDTIEISSELRHILKGEGFRVVHDDFLSFQSLKRYDLVVMNPPFSNGEKHVLKALSFVRGGGRLVALLNAETLRNPYTNTRKELVATLATLKAKTTYRQNAFANAENKTGVEIAIISVELLEQERESILLEHLRKTVEQEPPKDYLTDNPLINNDKIKALAERYDYEARTGIFLINEYMGVTRYSQPIGNDNTPLLQMIVADGNNRVHDNPHKAKNQFLHNLRLRYWRALFDAKEFSDRLTSNVQSELYSRINEFSHFEFSLYNIYELYIELGNNLIDNIKGTIIKLFDDFTSRYSWADYSSNVLHYNGWKTNNAFKINNKVIIPIYGSCTFWRSDGTYSLGYEVKKKLNDIEKTFNYLSGNLDNDHGNLSAIIDQAERAGKRRGVHCKHFSASFFKKGTCHLVFHDPDLVKKFNIFAGQQKKWLPPGYGTTAYGDFDTDAQATIKSFDGGIAGYAHTVAKNDYFLMSDTPMRLLTLSA